MSYLDLNFNLSPQDIAIKQAAREFAREVIRPISKELDEMTAEEVIAPNSPFWDYMKQAYELGYHKVGIPKKYGGLEFTPLQVAIQTEEFCWASQGLAVAIGVSAQLALMSAVIADMVGNDDVVRDIIIPFCECTDGKMVGCWAITEPDHGSDTLMPYYKSFHNPEVEANCRATQDGDEWVITGQKSAWVCLGTVATHCLLYCQIDPSMGFAGSGVFVVPLGRPGVSKGKPLNKMGQRDLNQGEIFFDEVRIPKSYQLVGPDMYEGFLYATLCGTCGIMGIIGTGAARAAYDETLGYVKKRIQGGKPLIEYTHVKMTLFNMLRRVETSRLLARHAFVYNLENPDKAALEYSMMGKVQGTESAFKNAHEAIQLFGGNGVTKEFLIEKIFRDTRAALIEDGTSQTLSIAGGNLLGETYPRRG